MGVGHDWPHILSEYGNNEQVKSLLKEESVVLVFVLFLLFIICLF